MADGFQGRIPLHISNQTALVWSVDDVATLRATHHICGTLTGTLPHAGQQNVFLGLPLALLPEEVVVLVKNGIVALVDDTASHEAPTAEELAQWNEVRKAEGHRVSKNPTFTPPTLSDEALRKRLERQKRKEAVEATKKDEIMSEPLTPTTTSSTKEKSYSFTIPATSDVAWYRKKCYLTLEEAKEAGLWVYPSTAEEIAKCGVFEDLWKQGYYMGNGLRFGGDWLIYPGDPLRFHSHFVATVVPSLTEPILPIQIVAYGRLGTATKKSHLLCGWDSETQKVSYYTIEWAGFG